MKNFLLRMGKRYRPLSYIFLLLLPVACNETLEESNNAAPAIIHADPNNGEYAKLENVFQSLEYVPLEAGDLDGYLMTDWIMATVMDKGIFVFQDDTSFETLFAFTHDGKFRYRINNPGEGPGKMVSATGYFVSRTEEEVKILDAYQQKLLSFDWHTGQLKGEERLPVGYEKFIAAPDGGYLFFMSNMIDKEDTASHYNIFLTDAAFNTLEKHLKIPPYLINYRIKDYNFSNEVEGNFLFTHFLSNSIYEFNTSENIFQEKYKVDFGGNWIDEDVLERLSVDNGSVNRRSLVYSNKHHVFHILNLLHTEHYLLFTYPYGEHLHWVVYDKKQKKSRIFKTRDNTLDYGLVGRDKYPPITAYRDQVVFLLPSEEVKFHYESLKKHYSKEELAQMRRSSDFPLFEAMADSLSEYGNPVLVFAKLKEDLFQ